MVDDGEHVVSTTLAVGLRGAMWSERSGGAHSEMKRRKTMTELRFVRRTGHQLLHHSLLRHPPHTHRIL